MERTESEKGFDPSRLGDPVAMQTQWSPAKRGGTNIQTVRLIAANPDRMEFRATGGARFVYLLFMLCGGGMLAGTWFLAIVPHGFRLDLATVLVLLLGLVLLATGGSHLLSSFKPIVFDRARGFFWKGKHAPGKDYKESTTNDAAELERIHALQIISELRKSKKRSYYSYELNLVLSDGKRVNVVDHGAGDILRKDAATLSQFLEKPLWDASS